MRIRRTLSARGLIVPAVACTFAAGCARERPPYRLAVVLDQSGRDGAAMAAAHVNATGGINGHRLELVNISTLVASGRFAVETAERLAADGTVLAVIGHTNSSSSIAASPVYNARHLLQLSPATAALYGQAGAYSYRLVPSDDRQGAFLADQVLGRAGAVTPRVAVMYVNNDYGRPLHGVLAERLRRANVTPAYDAPYSDVASGDAPEFVAAIIRARPDVLFWLGRRADFAPIARQLQAALPSLSVIASDAFSRGVVRGDTGELFNSVQFVRFVQAASADTALRNFAAQWKRADRGDLNDQALLGYDAVSLLAQALRATDGARESLAPWLSALGKGLPPFQGLMGPITFTADRERVLPYHLVRAGHPARTQ